MVSVLTICGQSPISKNTYKLALLLDEAQQGELWTQLISSPSTLSVIVRSSWSLAASAADVLLSASLQRPSRGATSNRAAISSACTALRDKAFSALQWQVAAARCPRPVFLRLRSHWRSCAPIRMPQRVTMLTRHSKTDLERACFTSNQRCVLLPQRPVNGAL